MDKDLTDRIVELTKQLTPVPEMAVLLDMSERDLRAVIDDPSRPEYLIFRKALAEVANAIRCRDLELYNAGSPTAAAAVAGHLQSMLSSL